MSSNGFNQWDSEGNIVKSNVSNFDNDFGTNIAKSPVSFRYRFLAPEVVEDINLEDLSIKDKENQRKKRNVIPEMKVLLAISESENDNIRQLVQHPVIKSYTWLKWKLLRKYFNRNIRIRTMLMICLTWYIFATYGGAVWNQNKLYSAMIGEKSAEFKDHFCNDSSFNFRSLQDRSTNHYTKDWYILFAVHATVQVFFIIADIRTEITARYYSSHSQAEKNSVQTLAMAHLFDAMTLVLILITLIGADGVLWFIITVLLAYQCIKEYVQMVSSFPDYLFHMDNYFDMIQIFTICILLYYPNHIKDTAGFSVDKDDEDESNWANVCRVKRALAAMTILFTSVRLLMSIARHPGLEMCSIYFMMFYRVTGSFLKFLFWYSAFILAFGLGFYIIFHDDTEFHDSINGTTKEPPAPYTLTRSELYTLVNATNGEIENSSVLIIQPKTEDEESEETRFNVPYVALMRTTVMFIGEIDFTDLPIKGGNVSKTLVYLFVLCFIFLMVMVLMNLLNGMAVSDTGQILKEAVILSQSKFIQTLAYFEAVLFDNYEWQKLCFAIFPSLQTCIKKGMRSAGVLLFHSPYIGDNQDIALPFLSQENNFGYSSHSLTSELAQHDPIRPKNSVACCHSKRVITLLDKLKTFVLYRENQGSEGFLKDAREILFLQDYYKRHEDVIPMERQSVHSCPRSERFLSTWEQQRDKLGFKKATGYSRSSSVDDYNIQLR